MQCLALYEIGISTFQQAFNIFFYQLVLYLSLSLAYDYDLYVYSKAYTLTFRFVLEDQECTFLG